MRTTPTADERIEALSRFLAGSLSRRGLVPLSIGAVCGGLVSFLSGSEGEAGSHKKRRHRRRRRKRARRRERRRDDPQDQCIANTPVFESPAEACATDDECCDDGSCCTIDDGPGGLLTGCFDIRANQTLCGLSCDAVVNCLNFFPERQCVNGECVEV